MRGADKEHWQEIETDTNNPATISSIERHHFAPTTRYLYTVSWQVQMINNIKSFSKTINLIRIRCYHHLW